MTAPAPAPTRVARLIEAADRLGLVVVETPAEERPPGSDGRSWAISADRSKRYVSHALWVNWYPGPRGGRTYLTLYSTYRHRTKRITWASARSWLTIF